MSTAPPGGYMPATPPAPATPSPPPSPSPPSAQVRTAPYTTSPTGPTPVVQVSQQATLQQLAADTAASDPGASAKLAAWGLHAGSAPLVPDLTAYERTAMLARRPCHPRIVGAVGEDEDGRDLRHALWQLWLGLTGGWAWPESDRNPLADPPDADSGYGYADPLRSNYDIAAAVVGTGWDRWVLWCANTGLRCDYIPAGGFIPHTHTSNPVAYHIKDGCRGSIPAWPDVDQWAGWMDPSETLLAWWKFLEKQPSHPDRPFTLHAVGSIGPMPTHVYDEFCDNIFVSVYSGYQPAPGDTALPFRDADGNPFPAERIDESIEADTSTWDTRLSLVRPRFRAAEAALTMDVADEVIGVFEPGGTQDSLIDYEVSADAHVLHPPAPAPGALSAVRPDYRRLKGSSVADRFNRHATDHDVMRRGGLYEHDPDDPTARRDYLRAFLNYVAAECVLLCAAAHTESAIEPADITRSRTPTAQLTRDTLAAIGYIYDTRTALKEHQRQ